MCVIVIIKKFLKILGKVLGFEFSKYSIKLTAVTQ